MINNNPYNLPQKPQNKSNKIYTQPNLIKYRNQLLQNSQSSTQNSQYIHRLSPQKNSIHNKNTNNNQQHRQASTPLKTQSKHTIIHSPKIQIVNPSPSNPLYINLLAPKNAGTTRISGGITQIGSSDQKKQHLPKNFVKESNGTTHQNTIKQNINSNVSNNKVSQLQAKQLYDKIQQLSQSIKQNEKRIQILQNNKSYNIIENENKNKKSLSQNDILLQNNSSYNLQIKYEKLQNELQKQLKNKIKQEIKNQIYNVKIFQKDKIKWNQIGQQTLTQSYKNSLMVLKKQIQQIKNQNLQIQEQFTKKLEFFKGVINRIQHQSQNIGKEQSNYKSSVIKCSTTATLLRFIECFKVKKNIYNVKNGQRQVTITLTDNTYYIDNQGYLLDKQKYYLLDSRGNKIKLEEKHVTLLKQQNVLL